MEFHKILFNCYGFKKLVYDQLSITPVMIEFASKNFGQKSEEHADALYLNAKSNFMIKEKFKALEILKKAIAIQ